MGYSLNKLINLSASQTSLTDIYRVDNTDKTVRIKLGVGSPGQSALSKVKIGRTVLLDDHPGLIDFLDIGTNHAVNGKFLHIRTVITDIKGKPDDTSVDFTITGGPDGKYHAAMSRTVTTDGDSVFYEMEIFFFN